MPNKVRGASMDTRALAGIALAALMSGGAAAATIHGVRVSRDGLALRIPNGTGIYVKPPQHDPGQSIIFSNIGVKYPMGLYFCCSGATVAGPASPLGSQSWPAMQFTPDANATVKEIDVAVQLISGTDLADIALYDDAGGLPGKLLAKFKVSGFGNIGGCCGLSVGKSKTGITVKSGTPYWIAIITDKKGSDAFANWAFNSTDQLHALPSAVNKGAGWQSNGGAIPAASFAVYGN
jgi:hypothetical protein